MHVLAIIALFSPLVAMLFVRGILLVAVCVVCTGILIYLAAQESFAEGLFYSLLFIGYPLYTCVSDISDYIRHPAWNKTLTATQILYPFYAIAIIITIWRFISYLEKKIRDQEDQIKRLKWEIQDLSRNDKD